MGKKLSCPVLLASGSVVTSLATSNPKVIYEYGRSGIFTEPERGPLLDSHCVGGVQDVGNKIIL